MKNRKEARNQSTLFHLSNYTKIVFGKKKKPRLVSSLDSNEQIIYRDEAKKKKKFPSSRTCCSFDLIIESRCGDDVTGSPAKHPREGTKMFLRIKIRKKNQVAVNFLVYRFPVNKYFNVPLTRGLTDPVYFSHPLFFNYNFITDSFAEIFLFFSFLSRFLSRICPFIHSY